MHAFNLLSRLDRERRPVPGYEGYYADRHGTVFGRMNRVLRPYTDRGGYLRVKLRAERSRACRPKRIPVHRVILMAFVSLPPPWSECARHLDGNRKNNRLENLAWGTARQNAHDRFAHGTVPFGEDIPTHKLTWEAVRRIRDMRATGATLVSLGEEFGVAHSTIGKVCRDESWKEGTR